MLGLIALSENFTTVLCVLNYVCFMHIVVQLIVANYGLTLIRRILGYSRRDSANNAIDTFDGIDAL